MTVSSCNTATASTVRQNMLICAPGWPHAEYYGSELIAQRQVPH